MKKIKLTKGKFALVSDEDFDRVNQFKWYAYEGNKGVWYSKRACYVDGKQKQISMHAFILGLSGKEIIADHKNHDGLDNRRINLRKATRSQNQANRRSNKNSSSKYVGVFFNKKRKRYKAEIKKSPKTYFLGWFKDEEKAALAYDKKAFELFGEFANLNIK